MRRRYTRACAGNSRAWLAIALAVIVVLPIAAATAQTSQRARGRPPSRADILRGEYGQYRANNDLLFYHLDVRVDPQKKLISGKNTIRFKMLEDGARIQLDLTDVLAVDKVVMGDTQLMYQRDAGAVFVDFPEPLKAGEEYSIDFHYSGTPVETGRFGGMVFRKDPQGRHWIYTSCEGPGASVWWPNKDQWRDEPEEMKISVAVPNDLTDVSNGKFLGKTDLGDGYTRWDWHVTYPINNYNVALNIGAYVHFSDKLGDLPLDYYVLPENLDKAREQFKQARGTIEAFEHYFGEYPFARDGFKLVEVGYSGMEHQSAVAYGNGYENGYHGRDWTGVGINTRFDYIIIHESGHEWFGNAVSAADRADMWIHEGWTTYLECLYVEYHWGREDALRYTNALKRMVANRSPVIWARGVNAMPSQDMYMKGALFLHTLRSVIDDDELWKKLIRGFYQEHKYRNILTEDVVAFFSAESGRDLSPIFDQYLRHAAIPVLQLRFDEAAGVVAYRWQADVKDFAMPVRVGSSDAWQVIEPTNQWQTMKTPLKKDAFEVATDLYYVEVSKR